MIPAGQSIPFLTGLLPARITPSGYATNRLCKGAVMLFYPDSFKVSTPADGEILERDFHASPPRVRCVHQAGTGQALAAWPGRLDHADLRNRPQGRWHVP